MAKISSFQLPILYKSLDDPQIFVEISQDEAKAEIERQREKLDYVKNLYSPMDEAECLLNLLTQEFHMVLERPFPKEHVARFKRWIGFINYSVCL